MPTTSFPEEPKTEASGLEVSPQPLLSEEIRVIDFLLVAVVHRRRIFWATVVAAVIGVAVSLLLPKIYTAKTMILTPQDAPSATAALQGELGLFSSTMNASNNLGLTDPNDVYVAMLSSDSVARGVINRFDLRKEYDAATWTDAIKEFGSNLRVSSGHDGTITIEFDDQDPKRAAAVANGVVDAFRTLTQQNAVTDASQRRMYFGAQLDKARRELADAEVALKKAQEATGMLDLDKQTLAIVTAMATLKGQIAAQQVQVQGLRSFATSQNPDVIRAETELAAMQNQLVQFERTSAGGKGDIFVATKDLPSSGLEYLRRYRDVKFYEALYELMGKQYEAAVVDEATNGAIVQVVDPAVAPDKKSRPRRSFVVLAFLACGLIGAYAVAFTSELSARMELDPVDGPKLRTIRMCIPWAGEWRHAWRRLRSRSWFARREK
jgi:tyrosine-protein kinase Etk/Wzc